MFISEYSIPNAVVLLIERSSLLYQFWRYRHLHKMATHTFNSGIKMLLLQIWSTNMSYCYDIQISICKYNILRLWVEEFEMADNKGILQDFAEDLLTSMRRLLLHSVTFHIFMAVNRLSFSGAVLLYWISFQSISYSHYRQCFEQNCLQFHLSSFLGTSWTSTHFLAMFQRTTYWKCWYNFFVVYLHHSKGFIQQLAILYCNASMVLYLMVDKWLVSKM